MPVGSLGLNQLMAHRLLGLSLKLVLFKGANRYSVVTRYYC